MDEKIGKYSKFLETVSDSERPNLQSKLLSVKLMKEKLVAMTALSKAQTILAEMDVLVAENNLKSAIEELDKFTKDHSGAPPAGKKRSSSDRPESSKLKSHKEALTETDKNKTKVNSIEKRKENSSTKTIDKKKTEPQLSVDSQKSVQKPRSRTPTQRNAKKRCSDSSSKAPQPKRAKLTHDSKIIPTVDSDKSTLLGTTLSPISKTMCITKSVQTCKDWSDRQNSECTKCTEYFTNQIIEDDENTVLIEDFSVDRSTRQDAISLSEALQKIIPQKTERYNASDCRLPQSPVFSKVQLLFEDDPANVEKPKSSSVNVKTEVSDSDPLNNSTENLVNGLFRDIMQSKLKHDVIQPSSTSNTMSGTSPFCKVMLREILEQC